MKQVSTDDYLTSISASQTKVGEERVPAVILEIKKRGGDVVEVWFAMSEGDKVCTLLERLAKSIRAANTKVS